MRLGAEIGGIDLARQFQPQGKASGGPGYPGPRGKIATDGIGHARQFAGINLADDPQVMGIATIGEELGNRQLGRAGRGDISHQFAVQGFFEVAARGDPADTITRRQGLGK